MTTKSVALTLIIALATGQPASALAQESLRQSGGQSDWAVIQALPAGQKLEIETTAGERVEGKLGSKTDSGLTLVSKDKTVAINRTDVNKVYRFAGGSRLKTALIGVGIGAGIGLGIAFAALAVTDGSDEAGGVVTGGVLIGAGIGGAIGALAGKGSKRTLIYESR
jgi:hypothetical protein